LLAFLLGKSPAMMFLPFAGDVVECHSNDRCFTFQNLHAVGDQLPAKKTRLLVTPGSTAATNTPGTFP